MQAQDTIDGSQLTFGTDFYKYEFLLEENTVFPSLRSLHSTKNSRTPTTVVFASKEGSPLTSNKLKITNNISI